MKQVIVADKSLNMSPGKLAAMASHGSISFLTNWLRRNIDTEKRFVSYNHEDYGIKETATIDKDMYDKWINNSFTKIILEADGKEEMEQIVSTAKEYGLVNGVDFFNIVDESTEFEDVPTWAVIAFRPMENHVIDPITGNLNLYGKENSSLLEVPTDE